MWLSPYLPISHQALQNLPTSHLPSSVSVSENVSVRCLLSPLSSLLWIKTVVALRANPIPQAGVVGFPKEREPVTAVLT